LVTNGPYQLKRWSASSATFEAFRDLTYPLGVGSYDAYAVPRRAYITKIEYDGNQVRLLGDIETLVKFARSEKIERAPIQSVSREILRRAAPECRYVVIDNQDRVVLAGLSALGDDSTFRIDLNGKLTTGSYTVIALIAVNGNVMNADIRRFRAQVSSGG
jgi:hypothetical protein